MKIQLQGNPTAAERFSPANATFRKAGHTTAGVVTVTTFLGMVAAGFYILFFTGSCLIQPAQENLRASQIIMQRAEALQLFTGSQVRDSNNYRQPLLVEPPDAPGVSTTLAAGNTPDTGPPPHRVPASWPKPAAPTSPPSR